MEYWRISLPKDMMSLQERAKHLMDVSKGLFSDYPNTAKWVQFLANSILVPKATVGEIDFALKELISAFKIEYVGSDANSSYRERCYSAYSKLIWDMINKGASYDTFESLISAFESGTEVAGNISESLPSVSGL